MVSLNRAGDRVLNVHPLRFLETIYRKKDLRVAMREMQKKKWEWNQFMGGLIGSFQAENVRGNLTDEQITHFAASVHVDKEQLTPSIETKQWNNLVKTLNKITS